jgi:hypothetical protein
MHAPHAPGVLPFRGPADAGRSARQRTSVRPPRSSPRAADSKARQLQAAQRPLRVRDRQPGPLRHPGRSDEMDPVPRRIAHLLLPDPAIAAQHHRGEGDQAGAIKQHRPAAGQAIRVRHARTIAALPAARTSRPSTPAKSTTARGPECLPMQYYPVTEKRVRAAIDRVSGHPGGRTAARIQHA